MLGIDDGFFNDTDVGFSIQGFARQPIAPPGPAGYLFIDLGGSFLAINGDDDPINTPGTVSITSPMGMTQVFGLADLHSTRLRQIRRGSADVALGWHFNPPQRNDVTGSLLQFTTRLGGRLGHIKGRFDVRNTPALNAILATVQPGGFASVNSQVENGDTFGGLFGGFGFAVNTRQVCTRALGPLDISWGGDAEFAYDWIDFENFEDNGLGTAALLLNFSVSR